MPAARRRTPTLAAAVFLSLALMAMALAGACEREGDAGGEDTTAVTPDDQTREIETGQAAGDGDEANAEDADGDDRDGEGETQDAPDEHPDEHGEEHGEHDHGGIHLADVMVELGRRYSAIWFAGQVGNEPMVEYQIHEIEEMYDEVAEASPTENGVDVASRLQSDVVEPLEGLSAAAGESDIGGFEKTYTNIMDNCESCHADTGHDYLNLKKPEYNPYPNLDVTAAD